MNYYYMNDAGDVMGPVSKSALEELKNCGSLHNDTHICPEGTENWNKLSILITPDSERSTSPLKFNCYQCGQHISAQPAQQGRATNCPTCKEPLTVPVIDQVEETQSLVDAQASKKNKFNVKYLIAGCLAIIIISLLITVSVKDETQANENDQVQKLSEEFDLVIDKNNKGLYQSCYSHGQRSRFTNELLNEKEMQQYVVNLLEKKATNNNPKIFKLMMTGVSDGQEARENKFNQITLEPGPINPSLAYYCRRGNLEQVKRLATTNNVNKEDTWGIPLFEAVQAGHYKIVAYLLTLGATIDRADEYGIFPIHYASKFGDPDLFELLLNNGANPKRITTKANPSSQTAGLIYRNKAWQPIHYAAKSKNYLIVKKLMRLGVSPNTKDLEGSSAVDLARPLSIQWVKLLDPSGEQFNNYAERKNEAKGHILYNGFYQLINTDRTSIFRFHTDGTVSRIENSSSPEWVQAQTGVNTQESKATYTIQDGKIIIEYSWIYVSGVNDKGTTLKSKLQGSARGNSIVIKHDYDPSELVYKFFPDSKK